MTERSVILFVHIMKCYKLIYIVIIPNAFATELIKMIAAKIGHRYLIIKQKIAFRLKGWPSFVISASNFSTPTTFDIRRQVAIAAIGIITEFVIKSKKSRNCIPRILKFASGPYPRQESVPRRIMITPIKTVDFLRLQCNSSSKVETALSVSAMELVTAANSTNKKKTIPIAVPNPMFAKTFGIVINIKAGPDFNVAALPPEKAKTAGMIISPAMIAIAVDRKSVV